MDQIFPDDVENLQYNKFQIAFGLTAYDSDPDPIEDPRYGRIYARFHQWGHGNSTEYTELPAHYCTDEELGLTNDRKDSRFFEIYENSLKDLNDYKRKMYCIDEKLYL